MTKRNASNKIMEGLGNLAHAAEQDHEVQMARAQLYKLAKYSIQLHDKLKSVSEAEGLEGWVQAKITKSADMISNVFHHLDYQEVDDEPMMDLDLPAQEMAEGINHATKYFQVSARANFYNGKRYEDGLSIFYIQAPDEAGAKELANQNISTITDMFKSKKLRSGKPELRKNDNVPVRIGRIKELTGSFRAKVLTSAGQFERITHDGTVAEEITNATKYFQVSARANFYNGKQYEDGLSIFYIQAPDEAGAKELANQNIGTITDMFKSKKLRSGKPELRKNDNVPVRIGRIKELTGSFRTLVLTSAGQFERITHDGSVAEGKQKDVYKESLQNKLTTKLTTKTK